MDTTALTSEISHATIGFIGVGKIASAMVDGLASSGARIVLSPRSRERAADLAARHANVEVCESNQLVVDEAQVVVVAVRTDQVADVLAPLTVPADRLVICASAGVAHEVFERAIGSVPVVRSVPLPSVRDHAGRTAIFPDHPSARALFDHLGGTVAVDDDAAFDALCTAASTMTTLLHYLATVVDWATENGVPADEAEAFVQGIAGGTLSELSPTAPLRHVADGHETPGGLNEYVRTTWLEPRRDDLRSTLDDVFRRVRGAD